MDIDQDQLPQLPLSEYDSDTATPEEREDYYERCKSFWFLLNDALDEDQKLVPQNGTVPTYDEATRLIELMKEPRRRKLFWIATAGFTWPEYPNDDAIFRAEEEEGLGFETRVRDDDDVELEIAPDMPDESMPLDNIPPEDPEIPRDVNDNVPMIPNILAGNNPVIQVEHDVYTISSDEEEEFDFTQRSTNFGIIINASASQGFQLAPLDDDMPFDNDFEPHDRPSNEVADEMAGVDNQLQTISLEPQAVSTSSDITNVNATIATSSLAQQPTTFIAELSSPVDAVVTSEPCPLYAPPLSPGSQPVKAKPSQDSVIVLETDSSSIPTPQSSQNQEKVAPPKKITPKRKRIIIDDTDEEQTSQDTSIKSETSYFDEMNDGEAQKDGESSTKKSKKGKKKKSKTPPITRSRSKNAARIIPTTFQPPRKQTRFTLPDNSDDEDGSTPNEHDDLYTSTSADSDDFIDDSDVEELSVVDAYTKREKTRKEKESESDSEESDSDSDAKVKTKTALVSDIFTTDDTSIKDPLRKLPKAVITPKSTTPRRNEPFLAKLGPSRYSSDSVPSSSRDRSTSSARRITPSTRTSVDFTLPQQHQPPRPSSNSSNASSIPPDEEFEEIDKSTNVKYVDGTNTGQPDMFVKYGNGRICKFRCTHLTTIRNIGWMMYNCVGCEKFNEKTYGKKSSKSGKVYGSKKHHPQCKRLPNIVME